MEEEIPTLEEQFFAFSNFLNPKSEATSITLYQSDYWLRQARILEDRNLTMTDTGIIWQSFNKTELTFEQWSLMLERICESKGLNIEQVHLALTSCGLPGSVHVFVPQYRVLFKTYRSRNAMINTKEKKSVA